MRTNNAHPCVNQSSASPAGPESDLRTDHKCITLHPQYLVLPPSTPNWLFHLTRVLGVQHFPRNGTTINTRLSTVYGSRVVIQDEKIT